MTAASADKPPAWQDRPIGSLLDVRLGTAVQLYVGLVLIGLIAGVVGLIVVASRAGGGGEDPSFVVSAEGAGFHEPGTMALSEFRALREGSRRSAVQERFGSGRKVEASRGLPAGERCTAYERRAGRRPEQLVLCHRDDRLSSKLRPDG